MSKNQLKQKNKFDITEFDMLYDNVLVKAIEIEEVSGIIKPNQYEDKPELGEVVAVGHGKLTDKGELVPLSLMVGDTVYFNKYSTTKFRSEGLDYYVIREEDCIGFNRKHKL